MSFPRKSLTVTEGFPAEPGGSADHQSAQSRVFTFEGKIGLVVRVAEGTAQKEGAMLFPALNSKGESEIIEVQLNDPDLIYTDARVLNYKGLDYLTTVSHLRILYNEDGIHFQEAASSASLFGQGKLERFGIEDCRVTHFEDTYYLTYTAVSDSGVGIGLRTTKDWRDFESGGMILPPPNKDCAIFVEKINNKFCYLHRPSSKEIGGNYIWMAESSDGRQWGNHQCLIKSRPGLWGNARVGAGAAPIKTE